jgi:hypothetical protein
MDEPAAGVDAACCGVNLASPALWVRGWSWATELFGGAQNGKTGVLSSEQRAESYGRAGGGGRRCLLWGEPGLPRIVGSGGGLGFFASCDLVPFHGSRPAGWASYSGAEALMISLRLRHDQGRALIQKRIFPQAVKLVP